MNSITHPGLSALVEFTPFGVPRAHQGVPPTDAPCLTQLQEVAHG
jgi:hypothetical protein